MWLFRSHNKQVFRKKFTAFCGQHFYRTLCVSSIYAHMKKTYYDFISSGYDELHKHEQRRKLKLIVDNLESGTVRPNDFLLDVGCGSGIATEFFKCVHVGLDPAFELIKLCKMEVILGRGEYLPFRDHQFDIVLCLTALHNFEDPAIGLHEMKRVGKKWWFITIFKRSANVARTESLIQMVKTQFKVYKELDDQHDYIFLCKDERFPQ